MGTWGSGNLDNDYALDEIYRRSKTLVAELWARARAKTSREADEYDHTTLFVEFEILFALEAAALFSISCLPPPEEVSALSASFIQDWDAYIDGLEPTPDHKRDRRKVILDTFERFRALCEKNAKRIE